MARIKYFIGAGILASLTIMVAYAGSARLPEYQWQYRLIAVFATTQAEFADVSARLRHEPGFAERDIAWFVVYNGTVASNLENPPPAAEVRRLRSQPGFEAVLVGKDGTIKLRQAERLDLDALKSRIDRIPVRQRDMRTRSRRD